MGAGGTSGRTGGRGPQGAAVPGGGGVHVRCHDLHPGSWLSRHHQRWYQCSQYARCRRCNIRRMCHSQHFAKQQALFTRKRRKGCNIFRCCSVRHPHNCCSELLSFIRCDWRDHHPMIRRNARIKYWDGFRLDRMSQWQQLPEGPSHLLLSIRSDFQCTTFTLTDQNYGINSLEYLTTCSVFHNTSMTTSHKTQSKFSPRNRRLHH